MSFHQRTADAAKGKWRGILMHLGVPCEALKNKHGPCPLCGGDDRFRFDNIDGKGTYICNNCGAGDGMALAIAFTGKAFSEVAAQIDGILGNVKPDAPPRAPMSDSDRRQALIEAWTQGKPIVPGDLAHRYLAARGVDEVIYPKAMRFAPALRDGEGGVRPCIMALVGVYGEKAVSLHRTFLRADGMAKAEMAAPRKMMPGELPDGACVQLSEWTGKGTLGIAEGIETAMSASALFDLPVWAGINTSIMAKWLPPPGCDDVAIFADNDAKFGGQAAAYHLAHRLACKGMAVTVHMPPTAGQDWNDVLISRRTSRTA
jgi:putative DNA primase/helicase